MYQDGGIIQLKTAYFAPFETYVILMRSYAHNRISTSFAIHVFCHDHYTNDPFFIGRRMTCLPDLHVSLTFLCVHCYHQRL